MGCGGKPFDPRSRSATLPPPPPLNRSILLAAAALVAGPALAQKPHDARRLGLGLGADPTAAVSADGLTALRSGHPAMIANVHRAVGEHFQASHRVTLVK